MKMLKLKTSLGFVLAGLVACTAQATTTTVNPGEYLDYIGKNGIQDTFNNHGRTNWEGVAVFGLLNNYGLFYADSTLEVSGSGHIVNHPGGHVLLLESGLHLWTTSALFENQGRLTVIDNHTGVIFPFIYTM
ncbi:MAG: hypothetical protein LUQ11_03780 [Methylococcaceae bacterium]|nr:hypothetical protein [Methylococcaceae bacterium]